MVFEISVRAQRAIHYNDKGPHKVQCFRRVLVKDSIADKADHATLYINDVAAVLQKKVKFCGNEDSMYHEEKGIALSRVVLRSNSIHYRL